MAENEERELQNVLDEVDELWDPSLDNLDIKTLIEHDVNDEIGSQSWLQVLEVRGFHPRGAGDSGDPGETRDPRGRKT